MSEPSSSVENSQRTPKPNSKSKPRHISEEEMHRILHREFYRNPEANFLWRLSQGLADTAIRGEKGRFRAAPVFLMTGSAVLVTVLVFLFFDLLR